MKKTIAFVLVGLILCSCGSGKPKQKETEYVKFIKECMERNGTDFFTDGWYEIVRTFVVYGENSIYKYTYEYLKGNLSFEHSGYIDNFNGCAIRINELFYQYFESDYFVHELKIKDQICALTTNIPYNTLTTYGQTLERKLRIFVPDLCHPFFNYEYGESGVNYKEYHDYGTYQTIDDDIYTFDDNVLIARTTDKTASFQQTLYTKRTYQDYFLTGVEYSKLIQPNSLSSRNYGYFSMKKCDPISIEIPSSFEHDITYLLNNTDSFPNRKNINLSF